MEPESFFIGIDVAKERMDMAVRPLDRTWRTSYDDDDVEVLVGQLQELSPTAVILEATGGIELPAGSSTGGRSSCLHPKRQGALQETDLEGL